MPSPEQERKAREPERDEGLRKEARRILTKNRRRTCEGCGCEPGRLESALDRFGKNGG